MSVPLLEEMVMRKRNQKSIARVITKAIMDNGHDPVMLFESSFFVTLTKDEENEMKPQLIVVAVDFKIRNRKGHC